MDNWRRWCAGLGRKRRKEIFRKKKKKKGSSYQDSCAEKSMELNKGQMEIDKVTTTDGSQ